MLTNNYWRSNILKNIHNLNDNIVKEGKTMSNFSEINNLLSDSCSLAPDMTHSLKIIGDGDMKKGLFTIAEYFAENGTKKGMKKGTICGVIGTAAVFIIAGQAKKMYDNIKVHQQKEEKIVNGLRQGIEESKTKKIDRYSDI